MDLKVASTFLHVGLILVAFKTLRFPVLADWWVLVDPSWMTTVANVPWDWQELDVNILFLLLIYFPRRLQSKQPDHPCLIMLRPSLATVSCTTMTSPSPKSKQKLKIFATWVLKKILFSVSLATQTPSIYASKSNPPMAFWSGLEAMRWVQPLTFYFWALRMDFYTSDSIWATAKEA